MDEGLDIGEFLRAEDVAHRRHRGDFVLLVALRDDLARLQQAFVNVSGGGARGDAIKGGANRAALALHGVAEDAGGGVFVKDLFAAVGVGDDEPVGIVERDQFREAHVVEQDFAAAGEDQVNGGLRAVTRVEVGRIDIADGGVSVARRSFCQ